MHEDSPTKSRNGVGSFRYFRTEDRWEWSDEVARMHGYEPGGVEPTTDLIMSHKHPDDAAKVALLLESMSGQGDPFSSSHRIIDTAGHTRNVLVVGQQLHDEAGAVIGSEGFYIDLSTLGPEQSVDAAIAEFTANRSQIEQAKGILMAIYKISADHAFDILVWRSQETNTKLRKLVQQIIEDFTTKLSVPASVRERADHLLLTTHKRIERPLIESTDE